MEALGLALVAALFGYFATIVVRRHEVLRSVALEVDEKLLEALNEAGRAIWGSDRGPDGLTTTALNAQARGSVYDLLMRAELHSRSLPRRQRSRVAGQIRVALAVTSRREQILKRRPGEDHGSHVVRAIIATREVVAPLLLPPPFFFRRPGRPRSYLDPVGFQNTIAGWEDADETYDRDAIRFPVPDE